MQKKLKKNNFPTDNIIPPVYIPQKTVPPKLTAQGVVTGLLGVSNLVGVQGFIRTRRNILMWLIMYLGQHWGSAASSITWSTFKSHKYFQGREKYQGGREGVTKQGWMKRSEAECAPFVVAWFYRTLMPGICNQLQEWKKGVRMGGGAWSWDRERYILEKESISTGEGAITTKKAHKQTINRWQTDAAKTQRELLVVGALAEGAPPPLSHMTIG